MQTEYTISFRGKLVTIRKTKRDFLWEKLQACKAVLSDREGLYSLSEKQTAKAVYKRTKVELERGYK